MEPLDLINIQLSALFLMDKNSRLTSIPEPGFDASELYAAPRFYMGRTRSGNIWRFRHDLPAELIHALDQLCHDEPIVAELAQPPQNREAIRAMLNDHKKVTEAWRGPAYWISNEMQLSAQSVLITEANKHLLNAHFPWKLSSRSNFKTAPLAATIYQDKAVSICYCARINAKAAEAGVETAESYRGRGFAGFAVARWAHVIGRQGLIPLYSTSWENISSQRIAQKLQMFHYGENWSIL